MSDGFKRNASVDFLKGIAILMVIVTHLGFTADQRKYFAFPFWIDMAVPVFMMLMGYVMSMSYARHGVDSLRDAYDVGRIIRSLSRIAVPYVLILPFEAIPRALQGASLWELFSCCIIGGWGPGGYYFPVMMELLVLLPAIYLLFRRSVSLGLASCVFINVVFEFFQHGIGLSDGLYRLIGLRYLGVVGIGMTMGALADVRQRTNGMIPLAACGLIGGAYLVFIQYVGMPPLIFDKWTCTSFPATLFVVPFVWRVVLMEPKLGFGVRMLSCIGAASWGVMLVQKSYYFMLAHVFNIHFDSLLISGVAAVVFCVAVGVCFDGISRKLVKWSDVCLFSWINVFEKAGRKGVVR